jgi:serine protease Do
VVEGQNELLVHLSDGQSFTARRLAHDHTNDLCLLGLVRPPDAKPLVAASFAVPDDLLLGETVIAVGNPFGLEHSVAQGVLSAKNRTYRSDALTFDDILQTDAAINPGNSGGPLVNLDGDLIGINIAIRRDAEGIGFAVPLQRIEDVLGRWMVPSRFSLGVCGFIPHTQVEDGELRVVVAEVVPLTPAAEAGLEAGDQIVAVNGTPVTRAFDVSRVLWTQRPGDRVRLELRGRETVTVTVKRMPPWMLVYNRLGIKVQELTPSLCRALGLPEDMRGLTVSDFGPDEAFQEAGAQRGDIIFRIADRETPSVEAAYEVLQSLTPGTVVPVFMVRVQPYQGRLLGSRYALQVTLR